MDLLATTVAVVPPGVTSLLTAIVSGVQLFTMWKDLSSINITSAGGYNPYSDNTVTGYNPYSGSSGYNPYSGSTGYNPYSGSSGYNPYSGSSGYNPYSGDSGGLDTASSGYSSGYSVSDGGYSAREHGSIVVVGPEYSPYAISRADAGVAGRGHGGGRSRSSSRLGSQPPAPVSWFDEGKWLPIIEQPRAPPATAG